MMSLMLWISILLRSKYIKIAREDEYWSVYDGVLF